MRSCRSRAFSAELRSPFTLIHYDCGSVCKMARSSNDARGAGADAGAKTFIVPSATSCYVLTIINAAFRLPHHAVRASDTSPNPLVGIALSCAGYSLFAIQDAVVKWLVADYAVPQVCLSAA